MMLYFGGGIEVIYDLNREEMEMGYERWRGQ
jgi:hypothetical protein